MTRIPVAYLPLTDALPLLAVQQLRLDRAHGFSLQLERMGSWAQLRDALLTGQVLAAQCLPGIPLMAQAGAYGPDAALASAFTLNHFGNAISVNRNLFGDDPALIGQRLRALCETAASRGRPLTMASVFPVSKHEFELRYWLRTFGLDPRRDLKLLVIPPPQMAAALADGRIDGFCVGEPWNTLTEAQGLGRIVASSRSLGLPGTEKVLAVQDYWLETSAHHALLASLDEACIWLASPRHRRQAALWLAPLLDVPVEIVARALGRESDEDFVVFSGINRPDPAHAAWLLDQIQTQLDVPLAQPPEQLCRRAFRPDIYDAVIGRGTRATRLAMVQNAPE